MIQSRLALRHRDSTQLDEPFARALTEHINHMRAETHPDDPPIDPTSIWGQMQRMPPMLELDFWTAEDDGQIVAYARTQFMNQESNQHVADLDVTVSPAERGHGLGTQLMSLAARAMQERGRTLLLVSTTDRIPAGENFVERTGFQRGLDGHENRLKLSEIPGDLLARWTSRDSDGYTMEHWSGPVPEADLVEYADLLNVMNSAPRDGLDIEDHRVTPEEIRSMEAMAQAGGRQALTAVVRAPDGTLAGLNDLWWRSGQPELVVQGNTGVLPGHRGHNLGRWLKAANVREMQRLNPQARTISTHNADSNGPMLRINTEMGFRPYRTTTVWQGEVGSVLDHLQLSEKRK